MAEPTWLGLGLGLGLGLRLGLGLGLGLGLRLGFATGSMIDSSGSMSPGVGWWSTTHTCSALSSQPPATVGIAIVSQYSRAQPARPPATVTPSPSSSS